MLLYQDVDLLLLKRVIEYLVSKNYLRQEHFNTWENLKSLHILTPGEAQQMIQFKRKERRAILNLQKDYVTSKQELLIMVLEKSTFWFLFVEQQRLMMKTLMRKKKTIIFNQFIVSLERNLKHILFKERTWKHKIMGIF